MLVDTSVWVDHLRHGNARLAARLDADQVRSHPFVIGELACGNLSNRVELLNLLAALPVVPVADHDEVLNFVESRRLMGQGLGWIDMHLLASATLGSVAFWTMDKRLAAVARKLGLFANPA
ncbi:MAG TPA: PIN domain-containing protein [Gammaproteobacteria bacterium]|jgi:predicted nucleic acid-binding protein